jgi:enoyl-CoA hydratase
VELDTLIYDKDGHVATVTLNRPEAANALSGKLRDELDLIIGDLEADDEVRAVLIRANGRHFCSGYDMMGSGRAGERDGYAERRPETQAASWQRRRFHLSRERWLRLWRVRQVTIGVVHGKCLAGGVDLIGALDIVFAAEDALIGQPQGRAMGELHIFGMWPVLLGMRRSKEWLFTGDSMTGAEAERMGLVNRAVPADELDAVARAYADRVANIPLDLLYSHKDAVNRWFDAMGIMAGMASANDLDAIDYSGPTMAEFGRRIAEEGFQRALAWRDGPFREHRTYWEAYQASKAQEPDE